MWCMHATVSVSGVVAVADRAKPFACMTVYNDDERTCMACRSTLTHTQLRHGLDLLARTLVLTLVAPTYSVALQLNTRQPRPPTSLHHQHQSHQRPRTFLLPLCPPVLVQGRVGMSSLTPRFGCAAKASRKGHAPQRHAATAAAGTTTVVVVPRSCALARCSPRDNQAGCVRGTTRSFEDGGWGATRGLGPAPQLG